jgi:hypothetical protein
MQHFVIKDVTQKPGRHEGLIKRRIDSNDAIFFLNRPKDKIFPRPMFSPAAPRNFVAAKTPAEIPFV